jgi:uncharacterized protein
LTTRNKPLIVWRVFDSRIGHDIQSLGLVQALSRLTSVQIYNIKAPGLAAMLSGLLKRKFVDAEDFPAPDIIMAAGHSTHLSLLCTKLLHGGLNIVIMKPSFPCSWFDLCLIPEHDNPKHENNIIVTAGALTTICPSVSKESGKGLILIGGSSKHYSWDDRTLIKQLKKIFSSTSVQWTITDSPRTPATTKNKLSGLEFKNLTYKPFSETTRDWLEEQLKLCSEIWVTEDSISMISESITSGAGVGLLSVPGGEIGRVPNAIKKLSDSNQVTLFKAWESGQKLIPVNPPRNEAERCAKFLLNHFSSTTSTKA